MNRVTNFRESGMVLTGILTVWYFYFSLYYIFNGKLNLSGIQYDIDFSPPKFFLLKKGQILFFAYFVLLVVVAGIQSTGFISNQKIQFRRNLKLLFLWIALAVLIFLFTSSSYELIYMIAIPSSILLSLFFTIDNLKWVKEITFFLLVIITIVNQFLPDLIP